MWSIQDWNRYVGHHSYVFVLPKHWNAFIHIVMMRLVRLANSPLKRQSCHHADTFINTISWNASRNSGSISTCSGSGEIHYVSRGQDKHQFNQTKVNNASLTCYCFIIGVIHLEPLREQQRTDRTPVSILKSALWLKPFFAFTSHIDGCSLLWHLHKTRIHFWFKLTPLRIFTHWQCICRDRRAFDAKRRPLHTQQLYADWWLSNGLDRGSFPVNVFTFQVRVHVDSHDKWVRLRPWCLLNQTWRSRSAV